jgi:hypothetical protein
MKRIFGLFVMGFVLCSLAAGNAWSADNQPPKNVKYHVICETSSMGSADEIISNLSLKVTELMNSGWKPVGGGFSFGAVMCQSLIR